MAVRTGCVFVSYPVQSAYCPGRFLDWLLIYLGLKTDLELAAQLQTSASIVSRSRNIAGAFGPAMMMRIYELTGVEMKEIRLISGDRRAHVRFGHSERKSAGILLRDTKRRNPGDVNSDVKKLHAFHPRQYAMELNNAPRIRRAGSFMLWNSQYLVSRLAFESVRASDQPLSFLGARPEN